MFTLIYNFYAYCKKQSERKLTLVVIGLDNAGKTTLLNSLQGHPEKDTAPTFGFNSVSLAEGKFKLEFFDLGGGKNIRMVWKKYFAEVHGLIFVLDSADAQRFEEATQVLDDVLHSAFAVDKPLLVFANKQDLPTAAGSAEVAKALHLVDFEGSSFNVLACTAKPPKGSPPDPRIRIGLKWLVSSINSEYMQLGRRVKQESEAYQKEEALKKKEREERVRRQREERLRREKEKEEEEAEAAGGAAVGDAAEKPAEKQKDKEALGQPNSRGGGQGRTEEDSMTLPSAINIMSSQDGEWRKLPPAAGTSNSQNVTSASTTSKGAESERLALLLGKGKVGSAAVAESGHRGNGKAFEQTQIEIHEQGRQGHDGRAMGGNGASESAEVAAGFDSQPLPPSNNLLMSVRPPSATGDGHSKSPGPSSRPPPLATPSMDGCGVPNQIASPTLDLALTSPITFTDLEGSSAAASAGLKASGFSSARDGAFSSSAGRSENHLKAAYASPPTAVEKSQRTISSAHGSLSTSTRAGAEIRQISEPAMDLAASSGGLGPESRIHPGGMEAVEVVVSSGKAAAARDPFNKTRSNGTPTTATVILGPAAGAVEVFESKMIFGLGGGSHSSNKVAPLVPCI